MSAAKKANTKAAASATYAFRDIVLGKVRGYQPWPGMVIDPDTAPPAVAQERPQKAAKNSHYCVKFFPKGDHAWLPPSSLSRLQQHEIQAFIDEPPKGQANKKDLLEGYKIAADPRDWEANQAALAAAAQEELDEADVDELDGASEGSADSKPAAKKRKRASEGGRAGKKVERSAAESGSAVPAKKRAPRKSNGKKSKDTIESEDDAVADGEADDAGPSKAQNSPPPPKKAKHNKDDGPLADDKEAQKVKTWRHTLQKTFLTGNSGAKAEDIPGSDQLFTEIEQYDGMTVNYLSYSKIGKVMRHIHLLDESKIPDEATYGFRKRAKALVDKWQTQLHASGGAASPTVEKPAVEKPAAKEAESSAKEEEKQEEKKEAETNGDAKEETTAEKEKEDAVMEDAKPAEADAAAPAEPAVAVEADVAMAEA